MSEPQKIFMVDIETTGVDFIRDDILQIAILALEQNKNGYWEPDALFEKHLKTDKLPKDPFALTYMGPLYAKSREIPDFEFPHAVRGEIKGWLAQQGAFNMAIPCGHNAAAFDLPFLFGKGYAKPPAYDSNNVPSGDFHYRVYELNGSINILSDILRVDRKVVLQTALERGEHSPYLPKMPELLPGRREHDAVFDCYKQTKILNGLICLGRNKDGQK